MARHKDFGDSGVYRPEELEDISFDLLGQTFRCVSILPGSALVQIIETTESGNGVGVINELFRDAIVEEDQERFFALLDGKEFVVSIETLLEILQWLVEQYAQRPTKRPSSSEDGQSTTGLISEDGISSTPGSLEE
jgi:hypothetical protein